MKFFSYICNCVALDTGMCGLLVGSRLKYPCGGWRFIRKHRKVVAGLNEKVLFASKLIFLKDPTRAF